MGDWLVGTRQLDLANPRLRITAQKLTQSRQTAAGRAAAVQEFVRRLPFAASTIGGTGTASEILDWGRGDCLAKGVLFTALCRAAGLPARLLFVKVRTRFLGGILDRRPDAMVHAVGQVCSEGRWHSTDGYVVDPVLFACAKHKLEAEGLDCGWGIVRGASGSWDGCTPCLQQFGAADLIETYGAFHDVDDFQRSVDPADAVGSGFLYSLGASLVNWRVRQIRRAGAAA